VSKIALGTVQFGIDYGINSENGQVRPEEVRSILNYAHSQNIDLLEESVNRIIDFLKSKAIIN
jgi:hypothetical protein